MIMNSAMIKNSLWAWTVSTAALLAAGKAVSTVIAESGTTSLTRMAVAAGVLSLSTSIVGAAATPRDERTRLRGLLWAGLVPLLVGMINMAMVLPGHGIATATFSLLPWLAGPLLILIAAPALPALLHPSAWRGDRVRQGGSYT